MGRGGTRERTHKTHANQAGTNIQEKTRTPTRLTQEQHNTTHNTKLQNNRTTTRSHNEQHYRKIKTTKQTRQSTQHINKHTQT